MLLSPWWNVSSRLVGEGWEGGLTWESDGDSELGGMERDPS